MSSSDDASDALAYLVSSMTSSLTREQKNGEAERLLAERQFDKDIMTVPSDVLEYLNSARFRGSNNYVRSIRYNPDLRTNPELHNFMVERLMRFSELDPRAGTNELARQTVEMAIQLYGVDNSMCDPSYWYDHGFKSSHSDVLSKQATWHINGQPKMPDIRFNPKREFY